MNKHKKLAPNQGLIPKIQKPPISVEKFLEKLATRRALVQYRNDIVQAQHRQNYINEYDRIAGILHKSITNGYMDHSRLKDRQAELKKLYEQSFEKPSHEITRK